MPQRAPIGAGFGRLWAASTVGNLGDGIGRIAIALLAARLTRDPLAVATVTALSYLPWLLLGLPAGAIVDRYDRRWLAVLAGALRPVAVAILAGAAATGHASLWLLYAVVLLLYSCETVYDNAVPSMVPMVVSDREDLERAHGWLQTGQLVADRFAGPPLGAILFALATAYAFGVTAACFALAAVLLLTLPGSYRAQGPGDGDTAPLPPSLRREVVEGLRYVAGHGLHRVLLGLMMLVFFGGAMVNATMVLWALEVLGVSEAAYGVLTLAVAAGALAGSRSAAWLTRRAGRGRGLWIAVVVAGVAAVAAAATSSPYAAGLAGAVLGWANVVFNVVNVSLRQRLTPPAMLGRVMGIYRTGTVSVMLAGAVAGGAVASAGGLRLPWLLFGAPAPAAAAVMFRRLGNEPVRAALAAAEHGSRSAGEHSLRFGRE